MSSCIVIEDDFKGYDPEMFNIPELYRGCIDSVMISEGMVSDRLDKVALQVSIFDIFLSPSATVWTWLRSK